MISASPKQYGIIEVNRPASGEAGKRFLSIAQEECRRYIGQVSLATTTSLELVISSGQPDLNYVSRPVFSDPFEFSPANELNLVLLHRGVPKEQARYYKTKETAVDLASSQLLASANHRTEDRNSDIDELKYACEQIARRCGLSFNNMPISFDRIAKLSKSPGRDFIYALLPTKNEPVTACSELMAEKADSSLQLVNEALHKVRPACGVNSKQGIAVPFARIPSNVDKRKMVRLLDSWRQLVSPDKPLKMYLSDLQTIAK